MADISSNQDKMQRWFNQAQGTLPKPQGTLPPVQQVPTKPTAIPQDMGALPPLSFDNNHLSNLPYNSGFSNPLGVQETPVQAMSRSNTFLRPGMTVSTLPRVLNPQVAQAPITNNNNVGYPSTEDLINQARGYKF